MLSSVDVHNRLQELDIPHEIFKLSSKARGLEQAAAALGLKLDQLAKIEVFRVEDNPAIVIIPGGRQVDILKLERVTGSDKVRPIEKSEISSVTGYHGDALPPVGHKVEIPVYIDYYTLREDVVYTGSGEPATILKIRSYDLVRATGAEIVDVILLAESESGGD